MSKNIYHGSQNIIETPLYGEGKRHNDYGLGFYCTEIKELAKEWSVDYKRDGYVNQYQLDDNGLNVLYLNSDEYCILHWLALLLENRKFDVNSALAKAAKEYILANFLLDTSSYDVIIGYRADDSYFSFADDFIKGIISYRQLNNAMHLGNLGEQIVIKSPKAFEMLSFVECEYVSAMEWYAKKAARDADARNEYFHAERSNYQKGDLYITQILNEEMRADDPRLR